MEVITRTEVYAFVHRRILSPAGKGGEAWRHAFDAAVHDLVSCSDWSNFFSHADRFAVLLTVSRSLKITLLQFGKRFFQHGFRASNTNFFARLFAYPSAPRRAKKICLWSVAKRRSSIQSMIRAFLILSFHKLWSHLQSNRLINRRSKGTGL